MTEKTLFGNLPSVECQRCHKPLSNPASQARGYGPICYGKVAKEVDVKVEDSLRIEADTRVSDFALFDRIEDGVILRRDEAGYIHTNVPHLVVHHSPTGYEWGYGGSGPADLALNLVELALRRMNYKGPTTNDVWDKSTVFIMSMTIHQDLKREYIAGVPEEGGTFSWQQIMDWVEEQVAEKGDSLPLAMYGIVEE